jgi:thiosulfate reductase cytochrome b subunit
MNPPRDETLWRIARRRARFQRDLMSYAFTNTILIGIWYLTGGSMKHFWPGWVLLFWGIGIAAQYYRAYIKPDDTDLTEKEYQKLVEQQNKMQP